MSRHAFDSIRLANDVLVNCIRGWSSPVGIAVSF